jgi:hypothetical protein
VSFGKTLNLKTHMQRDSLYVDFGLITSSGKHTRNLCPEARSLVPHKLCSANHSTPQLRNWGYIVDESAKQWYCFYVYLDRNITFV